MKTGFFAIIMLALAVTGASAAQVVLPAALTIDEPRLYDGVDVVIGPGTRIIAARPFETMLHVRNGTLKVQGTPDRPVVVSGTGPAGGDDRNLIFIEKGRAEFTHVRFENAPWALHMHDAAVTVSRCVFEGGFGGVRFQGGPVVLEGNLFLGNEIGVRFLKAAPVISNNLFARNGKAVFIREDARPAIRGNQFAGNGIDLYAGFFQQHDVDATGNWFMAEARVYDMAQDTSAGARITTSPVLPSPPDWH